MAKAKKQSNDEIVETDVPVAIETPVTDLGEVGESGPAGDVEEQVEPASEPEVVSAPIVPAKAKEQIKKSTAVVGKKKLIIT